MLSLIMNVNVRSSIWSSCAIPKCDLLKIPTFLLGKFQCLFSKSISFSICKDSIKIVRHFRVHVSL